MSADRSLEDRRLLVDAFMEAPELLAFAEGSAGCFSRRSPDKTRGNEDCAALIPLGTDSGLLVVADGLGGMRAGAAASSVALHELVEALEHHVADGRDGADAMRNTILTAIENANREIQALGVGACTTLAIAEIQGRTVRSYHVGDSCVLVYGQKGREKLRTVAHSPVGYAVEAGLIDEREAMSHDDRHLVFNVVGTPEMRIEVGPRVELSDNDTVLVASDGLLDNLFANEIVETSRKGPLESVMNELVGEARKRMETALPGKPHKPDDLTLLVYRCGDSDVGEAG